LPGKAGVLFKRLKSMTMIKKPLGIWTLAMFSAIPEQTLGSIDNKPAQADIQRTV
jgi:hypothetical protein